MLKQSEKRTSLTHKQGCLCCDVWRLSFGFLFTSNRVGLASNFVAYGLMNGQNHKHWRDLFRSSASPSNVRRSSVHEIVVDAVKTWDSHSPHVREPKIVLHSGFQVLDSSPCHWNLDSGLQSLVGFRIVSGFHEQNIPGFRILSANIFRIPYPGRLPRFDFPARS